jgi:hypothetical protein
MTQEVRFGSKQKTDCMHKRVFYLLFFKKLG